MKLASTVPAILTVALLSANFWHFNPSANELEYWVAGGGAGDSHAAYHTCGFISRSVEGENYRGSPEGYMADVLESGGAKHGGSRLFLSIRMAKKFVEEGCGAR